MQHGETMRYLGTTDAQRADMLRTIGVSDVEALLERIPGKARLGRDLGPPPALAEGDLIRHLGGSPRRTLTPTPTSRSSAAGPTTTTCPA